MCTRFTTVSDPPRELVWPYIFQNFQNFRILLKNYKSIKFMFWKGPGQLFRPHTYLFRPGRKRSVSVGIGRNAGRKRSELVGIGRKSYRRGTSLVSCAVCKERGIFLQRGKGQPQGAIQKVHYWPTGV